MDTDLIWFYTRMHNLRCTDLMQGPVYGIYPIQNIKNDQLVPMFTYDDIFGTVLNRFIVQAIVDKPLTIYGKGTQIRGYINVIDSINCIKITLQNLPKKGELKIYNQFTEQFSVLELSKIVKKSLKKININVKVNKIENPRIEKEKHFYNAKHSNLEKLGLKPLKLSEEIIIDIANYCQKFKKNIDTKTIIPKVKWQ
jgi:UDP-sulfoquinovose synthase